MLQHKPTGNKKIAQPTSKIYNAASIAQHRLQGMNRVVEVKIVIEGTFIKVFNHFSLWQSASKHHRFELKLPFDALEDDENHELNAAQQFIGKRLTAMFSYKDIEDSPERAFVGVVMEVGYEQQESSLGNIVLSGYSPTILLDLAPHTQSFGGQQSISLASIAEQVIKEGINKDKYQVRVDCAYTKNLLYAAQYNETHYNYLARMAEAYGEQFFYDGEVLHFGQLPVPEKPLELIYGSNLSDVKVKMQACHVTPTFYGYSSSRDQKLTSVEAQVNHVSDIAKRAYQISKSKITTPSLRVAPIRASTDKDIEASQNGAAGSNASEVFVTTGSTSIPFLYPGCTADLRMRKRDTNETGYFTKIMITEVHHQVDGRGYYTGRFEAIASDSGHLPRPDFELPLAEAQVAKVVSNADPQNQGRVQVRFDWQLHDTTDWIRVMTPDAGSSNKVSKNRGFMAIPEVGDQVMIGFQHNHPDRPFVMGGMFHGKVGAGGGVDNRVKSLQTRSGHRLIFTEDESIILTDKSGNEIKLDTEGGNIEISAPNKIIINATDIQMNAYNNLEMNVSNNIIINAMSKLFIFTPFMKSIVSGFMSFFSRKTLFSSNETLDIEAKETKLHGKEKTVVHSDKQAIFNSKGTAEMYGEKGNKQSNKAIDMATTQTEIISTAIVYFRPNNNWNGEYGFDWLRENDNGLAPSNDPAYANIIEGGYHDGVTDLTGGAQGTAYAKLKREYKNIPISRKAPATGGTAPANHLSVEYFVPYINIFSKQFVDSLPATIVNKPKYEIEIKVLVEIEEDIDRLEFEYDTMLFEIDTPILSDKTKTNGLVNGSDNSIKITCLKDLDNEKEINIYAYPKKEPLKGKEVEHPALKTLPDLKQLINRKLAGKIIILKNNAAARKHQKLVLVPVKTNIFGIQNIGVFSALEKKKLQDGLYQCLVTSELELGPMLDLSNDSKFQIKTDNHGNKIYGEYIFENTTNDIKKTDGNINEDKAGIFSYIKNLYISQNPQYSGYYTMFSFDENTYDSFYDPSTGSAGAVPGQVEDINIKNVFLFNGIQGAMRGSDTISHEGLHGLGLFHTHKDGTHPIANVNIKYVFANGNKNPANSTDNIMSYGQKNKKSTWKWQWDIVKNNV